MSLPFDTTHFLTSAATMAQCPADHGFEFAFCGRSNAGKSSAINYVTRQGKLAKTSKTPGRTQLINFFEVTTSVRLVDLPGFGYAKVPEKMRQNWQRFIDDYLRQRESLIGIVVVMDIRHPLREFDQGMIGWATDIGLDCHVLLAKCDKLKTGRRNKACIDVQSELPDHVSCQVLSSTHDIGRETLIETLSSWVEKDRPQTS